MKAEPEKFESESTTVWSFPNRGDWATHRGDYRGNFSPYIPRNVILRYSKEGDIILDPMCGSGTALIESKLLHRNAIGLDINNNAVELSKNRIHFEYKTKTRQIVKLGDARKLNFKDGSIDLIVTHPPYLDIIKYNPKNKDDISNIHKVDQFLEQINLISKELYRVLKTDKYCAILIGDTRRKGMYVPLSHEVMEIFLKTGFKLKEDVIKVQWNCKATPYWKNLSKRYNFLLIMHEHLFIFRK